MSVSAEICAEQVTVCTFCGRPVGGVAAVSRLQYLSATSLDGDVWTLDKLQPISHKKPAVST